MGMGMAIAMHQLPPLKLNLMLIHKPYRLPRPLDGIRYYLYISGAGKKLTLYKAFCLPFFFFFLRSNKVWAGAGERKRTEEKEPNWTKGGECIKIWSWIFFGNWWVGKGNMTGCSYICMDVYMYNIAIGKYRNDLFCPHLLQSCGGMSHESALPLAFLSGVGRLSLFQREKRKIERKTKQKPGKLWRWWGWGWNYYRNVMLHWSMWRGITWPYIYT